MGITIFDKFAWHLDAGIDEHKLKDYFQKLMEFLKKYQLLNDYGLEIFNFGVDSSLSITSKMLTDDGNSFLSVWYDEYLVSVDFHKDIDFSFLDEKFLKICRVF